MAIPASTQTEIDRVRNGLQACFQAIRDKGVTVPADATSDDLYDLIMLIQSNTATFVVTSDTSGATVWAEKGSNRKDATASGTTYTIAGIDEYDDWTIKGTASGTTVTLATQTVDEDKTYNVTGKFKARVTATSSNTTYGTVSIPNGTATSDGKGQYVDVIKGSSVTITATTKSGGKFDGWSGGASGSSTSVTVTANADVNVTASFSQQSSSCVSGDTLITLADMSSKRIDQLTYNDMLLAYSLDTGEYRPAAISKIYCHGFEKDVAELRLTFNNNADVKIIPPHGFLDCTRHEFVQIDTTEYEQYIGDEFLLDNGERAILENVERIETVDEAWSLITKNDENFIASGLISITGHRYPLFPITENMVFDAEAKQSDIDTYGVFEYEQFADKMSEEDFYDLNCQYYKIPLEKGIIDMDYIEREIPMLISYNVIPKDTMEQIRDTDMDSEVEQVEIIEEENSIVQDVEEVEVTKN